MQVILVVSDMKTESFVVHASYEFKTLPRQGEGVMLLGGEVGVVEEILHVGESLIYIYVVIKAQIDIKSKELHKACLKYYEDKHNQKRLRKRQCSYKP